MGQSFSSMRRQLEKQNICDCLKGRIKYFLTLYRESHDGWEGRLAIYLDSKEVFHSNTFEWRRFSSDQWESGERNYEKIQIKSHNEGVVDVFSFYKSFYYYQNHSIKGCLSSPDPLVRLFAILDKRVGKRTIKKLEADVSMHPQWLQFFYQLRFDVERLNQPASQKHIE